MSTNFLKKADEVGDKSNQFIYLEDSVVPSDCKMYVTKSYFVELTIIFAKIIHLYILCGF